MWVRMSYTGRIGQSVIHRYLKKKKIERYLVIKDVNFITMWQSKKTMNCISIAET